jgi:hypothetical protein
VQRIWRVSGRTTPNSRSAPTTHHQESREASWVFHATAGVRDLVVAQGFDDLRDLRALAQHDLGLVQLGDDLL